MENSDRMWKSRSNDKWKDINRNKSNVDVAEGIFMNL